MNVHAGRLIFYLCEMHIFYAPDIVPPTHVLDEQESRHCVRVLRLGAGDTVHLADGRGGLYKARIAEAGRRCVLHVEGMEREWERRGYELTMAVAPTKNADRYEWFLEKATELGVDTLVPLLAEHGERRVFRPERAEKIITSAIKQSLKAYRPALEPLTPFTELVTRPFDGAKMIAHCAEGERKYISDCTRRGQKVLILIGPEGDFSSAEVGLARSHGFTEISLGPSRLRTETAAIAAVAEIAILNR